MFKPWYAEYFISQKFVSYFFGISYPRKLFNVRWNTINSSKHQKIWEKILAYWKDGNYGTLWKKSICFVHRIARLIYTEVNDAIHISTWLISSSILIPITSLMFSDLSSILTWWHQEYLMLSFHTLELDL